MSGIYIPNMKIPENENAILILATDGSVWEVDDLSDAGSNDRYISHASSLPLHGSVDAANVIEELSKCLATYVNAEAQRRLIVLPKTLYEADPTPLVGGVIEWTVTGVCYYDGAVQSYTVRSGDTLALISSPEIGKTVFLTREEAEAALERGRGDGTT